MSVYYYLDLLSGFHYAWDFGSWSQDSSRIRKVVLVLVLTEFCLVYISGSAMSVLNTIGHSLSFRIKVFSDLKYFVKAV